MASQADTARSEHWGFAPDNLIAMRRAAGEADVRAYGNSTAINLLPARPPSSATATPRLR